MSHSLAKLLVDVELAAELIDQFVQGVSHHAFVADAMRKSAVQMQFIVIGEALIRMRGQFPEAFAAITNAGRIVDFRNIIAHGYDSISDDLVWDAIKRHLPVLQDDVRRLKQGR